MKIIKYKYGGVLYCCLLVLLLSCKKQNEEIITKEIQVNKFLFITNNTNAPVNVKYGTKQKVEAIGNAEIIRKIEAKVVGENLNLKLKKGNLKPYELSFYITIPKPKKKSINDWAKIAVNDFIQSRN